MIAMLINLQLKPASGGTTVENCSVSLFDVLMTAEKVMENLAGMTSQVAPCDVSSVYGIRRAMGIAVPLETSESFIDLTTGDRLNVNIFVYVGPELTFAIVGYLFQCRRWLN